MEHETVMFEGVKSKSLSSVISALQVLRSIKKGCQAFLASVVDISRAMSSLSDVKIFQEFQNVFPKDLLSLPPKQEVKFSIELEPGTAPISKTPYIMATTKLRELKEQLQELLDKSFFQPSM